MKSIVILTINFYSYFLSFDRGLLRFLAPGGACRFSPTCSQYLKQSIIKFGIFKGGTLGLKRLVSCNPYF